MVRAHRLWESYLAQRANIGPDAVHAHAERLEHAHEFADELDASLGHPQRDPHGEEIPPAPGQGE
jgi:Mn-dependent DtxR family transcriptional regulator